MRYPVILPRKSWITKLIVKDFHEKGNHASGTNQTLAALSARYWVISGREVIRECEKECAECRRRKAKICQQVMAPLPLSRLKTSLRAFTRTAVDYAGPFITIQGRGKRRQKRYLCLFTCLATRAVHLEIAYSLDTDSFLNALYRMTSRRGLMEEMYSDNGTNFRAADKEMKSLILQLDQEKIKESIANKGIKWHRERRDLQVGEVVLVVSPDTARGNWPLGRVVEVYPGVDGRVRVAKLQVGEGTLVRPVVKLCPLECDS